MNSLKKEAAIMILNNFFSHQVKILWKVLMDFSLM